VGKREFSDVILRVVRQLPDSVEQDHYVSQVAKKIGVSKSAMEQKLRAGADTLGRPLKKPKVDVKFDLHEAERTKAQNQLMALTLMQPALRSYLKPITYDMLISEDAHQLLRFLQDNPEFSGDANQAEALRDIADYVKILGLQFEELYRGLELLELRNEAARMQVRLIEQYVKIKKQPLIEAMRTADESEATKLLEQATLHRASRC